VTNNGTALVNVLYLLTQAYIEVGINQAINTYKNVHQAHYRLVTSRAERHFLGNSLPCTEDGRNLDRYFLVVQTPMLMKASVTAIEI
jgi:hypothetical protein